MLGVYLQFDVKKKHLNEDMVKAMAYNANLCSTRSQNCQIAPFLWAKHLYHPVTSASPGLVKSPHNQLNLIMHGEVYNCAELAKFLEIDHAAQKGVKDGPEIVAVGIEKHGLDFCKKINGSFLLVIWYENFKKLYLVTDRFAHRSHYYSMVGTTFILSPRVDAIYKVWNKEKKLNPMAVAHFFAFQQLMGNETFIDGIKLLPPASVIEVGRKISISEYWDFPFPSSPSKMSYNEIQEEMINKLNIAVKRQLESDVPIGIPLSGGCDSRVITSIANRYKSGIQTFTFGERNSLERVFAKQIADKLGIQNTYVSSQDIDWISHYKSCVNLCEGSLPVLDSNISIIKSEMSKAGIGLVLDGLAGDLVFGSCITKEMANNYRPRNRCEWFLKHRYNSGVGISELSRLFVDKDFLEVIPDIGEILQQRIRKGTKTSLGNLGDYLHYRERVRRFTTNGQVLLRDNFEVRTPFFDYDLIDFALQVPVKMRYKERLYRDIIRKMFPDLRNIGTTPIGENFKYPFRICRFLSVFSKPHLLLVRQMPEFMKVPLRNFVRVLGGRNVSKVDFASVFGEELACFYKQLDDNNFNRKKIIRTGIVDEYLSQLKSGHGTRAAMKLSLYLTFQMYREFVRL